MCIAVIASLKKGLEHFIYRELLIFSAQGCRIVLFPTKYGKGLYSPHEDWNVHPWNVASVILLQPYFFLRSPLVYLRLLREALHFRALVEFALAWYFAPHMAAADVIYATFGDRKLYIGYFCKQITGKPLAVTIHAYELYLNPNPGLFPRALAACDQIITVTEYNKEFLAGRFHIDPANVEVVRISIDLEDYRPGRNFIILIVGFFVQRKGHEVLFQAVKELAMDDIEVWVVGDEGAEPSVDVRGLAVQLGVKSKVAFFGSLSGNALKATFRACDVLCLPCHKDSEGISEGFPTVLAEAMAFGKPVITTRHVEIPRVVTDILVDENDVHGLAQAIRTVYESSSLRDELGRRNRRIAEQLFSPRNASRTAAILATLAGEPSRSGRGGNGKQSARLVQQANDRPGALTETEGI